MRIVLAILRKLLGKGTPILLGKRVSSSSWSCTQVIRKSIYLGAEHLIGFFTWFPSAQWY